MTYATDFAEALDRKFKNDLALRQAKGLGKYIEHEKAYDFTVEAGKRFDRIVQQYQGSPQRSVHAFVEKSTGKLIKAAGWAAPAKRSNGEFQSQFDLSTPSGFEAALAAADRHGSYLYLR